ncbi:MAG: STAS domain-containing protein [Desulfovibrio sp.]|nr:STAS domain-containing protein [Desulfovibrio sp.]
MFTLIPEPHEDVLILRLTGDVRVTDAVEFNRQMDGHLASPKVRQIVLDMSKTGKIDRTCLGVLVSLNTILQGQGRRIVLLAPAPHVQQVLQAAEVEGFFPIYESEEEFQGYILLKN